eukprot:Rhum_TRINITY_DN9111_c0_g1::Rhum_TRINITY_DN9111_c0_g1_i1::g.31614::m.31614
MLRNPASFACARRTCKVPRTRLCSICASASATRSTDAPLPARRAAFATCRAVATTSARLYSSSVAAIAPAPRAAASSKASRGTGCPSAPAATSNAACPASASSAATGSARSNSCRTSGDAGSTCSGARTDRSTSRRRSPDRGARPHAASNAFSGLLASRHCPPAACTTTLLWYAAAADAATASPSLSRRARATPSANAPPPPPAAPPSTTHPTCFLKRSDADSPTGCGSGSGPSVKGRLANVSVTSGRAAAGFAAASLRRSSRTAACGTRRLPAYTRTPGHSTSISSGRSAAKASGSMPRARSASRTNDAPPPGAKPSKTPSAATTMPAAHSSRVRHTSSRRWQKRRDAEWASSSSPMAARRRSADDNAPSTRRRLEGGEGGMWEVLLSAARGCAPAIWTMKYRYCSF